MDKIINFANEINILGLTLKRTGIVSHIQKRINNAKTQTSKLKRFINLENKTKLHLYKSLVRPLLEYPVIPIALASKTQTLNIQRVQNRNIKMIVKNDEELHDKTVEEIHNSLGLEPMNLRLNDRMIRTWNKFEYHEPRTAKCFNKNERKPKK